MTTVENVTCDINDIILKEDNHESQGEETIQRRPKRVLQFSDGVLEEYSSDDETDDLTKPTNVIHIDEKTLNWLPWVWHQTTWASTKLLDGCDYVGEWLANFFGITSPKYQFEINEFYRLQALDQEKAQRNDLEMGGWNEQNRNNLING